MDGLPGGALRGGILLTINDEEARQPAVNIHL